MTGLLGVSVNPPAAISGKGWTVQLVAWAGSSPGCPVGLHPTCVPLLLSQAREGLQTARRQRGGGASVKGTLLDRGQKGGHAQVVGNPLEERGPDAPAGQQAGMAEVLHRSTPAVPSGPEQVPREQRGRTSGGERNVHGRKWRRAPNLQSPHDVVLSRGAGYSSKSAPEKAAQSMAGQRAVQRVLAELHHLLPGGHVADVLDRWREQLRAIDLNQVAKELGRGGHWRAALEVLEWMKVAGGDCAPNQITYVTCLTALGRAQQLEAAERLFQEVPALGLKRNVIVFNTMMSVYVRCARPSEALSLFPLMSGEGVLPDFFSYATAINACAASPAWLPRGISLFEQMRREGIPPDSVVYNTLMKACSRGGQPDEALRIFRQMQADGVKVTLLGYNTLLDAHAEMGQWQEGLGVLDEMRAAAFQPDVVSFNTLVKACCRAGKLREGLRVLGRMRAAGLRPNAATFTVLISGCASAGLCAEAAALYRELRKEGIRRDAVLFAALIDAADGMARVGECLGELAEAGVAKTGPVYTALVRAYSRLGHVDRIDAALVDARQELSKLDVGLYNAAMEAYSRAGRVADVVRVFDQLEGDTCTADEVSFTILMDALGKAGQLSAMVEALRKMRGAGLAPGQVQLNVLVDAFARAGEVDRAAELFEEMAGLGIEAGGHAYTSLLAAFARAGLVSSCMDTYRRMRRAGVQPTVETFSAMIDAFGRTKRVAEAESVFQRLCREGLQPDMVAFTALITAYGRAGLADQAVESFQQMQEAGWSADLVAYTALMSALHKEGRDRDLLVVFKEMLVAGVKPDRLAHNYRVSALCRLGRIEEAEAAVEDLWGGEGADVRSVNMLIEFYAGEQQVEKARGLFQLMRDHGPAPDVVTYTALIMAHGRLRQFDQAAALFKEMQNDGLDVRLNRPTYQTIQSIIRRARVKRLE